MFQSQIILCNAITFPFGWFSSFLIYIFSTLHWLYLWSSKLYLNVNAGTSWQFSSHFRMHAYFVVLGTNQGDFPALWRWWRRNGERKRIHVCDQGSSITRNRRGRAHTVALVVLLKPETQQMAFNTHIHTYTQISSPCSVLWLRCTLLPIGDKFTLYLLQPISKLYFDRSS